MFLTHKKIKEMLDSLLSKTVLRAAIVEAMGIDVAEIPGLRRELEELKLKKEIEIRDIEHLVKIKEGKLDLEHQRREVELQRAFNLKEMEMQNKYHQRVVDCIEKEHQSIKDIYTEIMKRLPNVNMEITKDITGRK